MEPKIRVVFDTNIFISAIIFGGNPRQCLELARENNINLFISHAILLELAKKLHEKFLWSNLEIKEVIEGISLFATLVFPNTKVNKIKLDPSDNMILEAALAARANFIISGDKKHILSLKQFKNIEILSANEFVKWFFKQI